MRSLETRSDSTDAAGCALNLVEQPRLATDAGLGGSALALRPNAGYAAQQGWAAP